MGIKDKLEEYQRDNFMEQYGDRITPVLGNLLAVKIERKTKFFLWHTLLVSLVVKPQNSKNVVRAQYKKGKFLKDPEFIALRQGNQVLVQGVKGDKGKEAAETVNIMNVVNLTDKTQLVQGDVSVDEIIAQVRGIKRQRS